MCSYSASVSGVTCGGTGSSPVLSGGFESGWHPGMAVEEVAEGVEFADAPFGGGGQVGLDDGEVGESLDGPPAAPGAALLDLDRPDCSFRLVVRENVQFRAGGEAEDHVLVLQEPAGDPAGVSRGVAGLDEQGRHAGGPVLLPGLEVVQVLQVAQEMRPAPRVQGVGEVAVAGVVAVADDDAGVAGQDAAGVDRGRGPVSYTHLTLPTIY